MDAQLVQPGRKAVEYGPRGWPPANRTLFPLIKRWCEENLLQPDGPDAGKPWRFTRQQCRYLAWWWAITAQGHWRYSRGVIRLMKGAGKDPLAAVVALVDLCCPHVVFKCWDRKTGLPLGQAHPAPWVQIVAVSRDQTETTMSLFNSMVSDKLRAKCDVRVGKQFVYAFGDRAKIQAVTSNPLSLEGKRPTLVIPNEIQNWFKSNQGHAMSGVINGNVAKNRGGVARRLSFCNAHVLGLDSVGEKQWESFLLQEAGETDDDMMYFALEAPPDTKLADPESLREALLLAAGDATWLDPDRLMKDIYDPETLPSESRRKYLNQVVAHEDAWIWPQEWDRLAAEPVTPLVIKDQIALGFDGSETNDHSALIAISIETGDWHTLGVWDPADYVDEDHPDGRLPTELVDQVVRKAFKDYDVVAFFSDVHPFESYVDAWHRDFGHKLCVKATARNHIAFDMRFRVKDFTLEGAVKMRSEIKKGLFKQDGHPKARRHLHNARARENDWGISIGKESRDSPRKIDSAAAGILARMAWRMYHALPPNKQRKRRTGRAGFF